MRFPRRTRRALWIALILAVLYGARNLPRLAELLGSHPASGRGAASSSIESGDPAIDRAFRERRSGVWVESNGLVDRVLPDDQKGSRHQRFILRMAHGQTLLVAHNIDLAPRVPLAVGDEISFRGEYEWNERGGVVHWTHHDPESGARRGWIRHRGRDYE